MNLFRILGSFWACVVLFGLLLVVLSPNKHRTPLLLSELIKQKGTVLVVEQQTATSPEMMNPSEKSNKSSQAQPDEVVSRASGVFVKQKGKQSSCSLIGIQTARDTWAKH